jgi:hypothetical protein
MEPAIKVESDPNPRCQNRSSQHLLSFILHKVLTQPIRPNSQSISLNTPSHQSKILELVSVADFTLFRSGVIKILEKPISLAVIQQQCAAFAMSSTLADAEFETSLWVADAGAIRNAPQPSVQPSGRTIAAQCAKPEAGVEGIDGN